MTATQRAPHASAEVSGHHAELATADFYRNHKLKPKEIGDRLR